VAYDDAPTVGNYHGQTGVWINTTTIADDAVSDYYSAVQDAYTGGQLGTATYSHNFYSVGALQGYANAYQNIPDGWDYAKAGYNMFAGIVETGFGVLTSEIGIGEYLMADGASRTLLAGAKIYALATSGRKAAEALPTNMAGMAGMGVDYFANTGDTFQQILNSATGAFQTQFGIDGIIDLGTFTYENWKKY
jgi:hypothetical protein